MPSKENENNENETIEDPMAKFRDEERRKRLQNSSLVEEITEERERGILGEQGDNPMSKLEKNLEQLSAQETENLVKSFQVCIIF